MLLQRRSQAALKAGIGIPTLMLYADSDSALGLPLLKVFNCDPMSRVCWYPCPFYPPSCVPMLSKGHKGAHY
jgi:hypothetical protein